MMKPNIRAIVPVYNGEKSIAACLRSLLAQTYPNNLYEIIVVENGSTDRTTEVVKGFPQVRLLHSLERGPAAARNLGITHSQAEIVAFTDADCIADKNWLAELIEGYDSPDVAGVCGRIEAYRHPERNSVEKFSDEHSPLLNFISGDTEFMPHLYTANGSYRRAVLERVGLFNSHLPTGEDVELSWRLQLNSGMRLAYSTDAVIYHHHRSNLRRLRRQYHQYGFGEVMLDTIFGDYPTYPRSRTFQLKRIFGQATVLPRYCVSMVVRRIRFARGLINHQEMVKPYYMLLIEVSNIHGKLEGLWATHLMKNTDRIMGQKIEKYIGRFY